MPIEIQVRLFLSSVKSSISFSTSIVSHGIHCGGMQTPKQGFVKPKSCGMHSKQSLASTGHKQRLTCDPDSMPSLTASRCSFAFMCSMPSLKDTGEFKWHSPAGKHACIPQRHARCFRVKSRFFQVTDPMEKVIHNKEDITKGSFAFTTTLAGDYIICFHNKGSSFSSVSPPFNMVNNHVITGYDDLFPVVYVSTC
jgi:hypothetical protein